MDIAKINAIVCGSRCLSCALNNSDLLWISLCSTATTTTNTTSKSPPIHLIGQHSKNHYHHDDLLYFAIQKYIKFRRFWVKFTVKTEFDNLVDERARRKRRIRMNLRKCEVLHIQRECKCWKCENVSSNVTCIFLISHLYNVHASLTTKCIYLCHISCSFIILYKILLTLSSLRQLLPIFRRSDSNLRFTITRFIQTFIDHLIS